MADTSHNAEDRSLRESLGLSHLFRTLGLAVEPRCLLFALVGIWATLFYGGCVLDPLWHGLGGERIAPEAVDRFIGALDANVPYEEPAGGAGIFQVLREHQRGVVSDMLSALPGVAAASGEPLPRPGAMASSAHGAASLVYGLWWLVRCHFVYALLLAAGLLLIWSFCGGAICRIAAVRFARATTLRVPQTCTFVKEHLVSGFIPAPCVPLVFMAIIALMMILFGILLRLPFLGDLVGGVAFALPLLGGFVIAVLLVGFFVGVSLFWPAVAVDGVDWFDAFGNGLSYPLSRPWKTVLYAAVAGFFGIACSMFVHLFTFIALSVTRSLVSWGTSPMGLWARGTAEAPISKMELLWPMTGPAAMYAWPNWSQLGFFECVSGALIGVCLSIVIGLMWSFPVSFYFSGSTVVYYLLRRDVNGTDLRELFVESDAWEPARIRSSAPPPAGLAPLNSTAPKSEEPPD